MGFRARWDKFWKKRLYARPSRTGDLPMALAFIGGLALIFILTHIFRFVWNAWKFLRSPFRPRYARRASH